ncbi:MAG: carbohydrate-binding protein, partial [Marinoscillum sp.]
AENWTVQSGTQTEACSEGGQNVGWIDTNDWMVWDVNPPASGAYTVEYRVSSPNGSGMIQLEKAGGSPVYGTRSVPNTGGWQNWTTVSHTISLSGGQQQIAIKALVGGWNINWLKITSAGGGRVATETAKPEPNEKITLSLFPNPTSSLLNIRGLQGSGSYQIYDLSGRVVLQGSLSNEEGLSVVDVSALKAGSYFLVESLSHTKMRFIKK